MARAKHEYVVGYDFDYCCIYGRDGRELGFTHHTDKLTLHQARRLLNSLPCDDSVIYKLVPIEEQ